MNKAEIEREQHAIKSGPRVFWGLSDETALSKMRDRIKRTVLEYKPTEPLLLLGPTGTGKSMGAMVALRRAVRSRELCVRSPGNVVFPFPKVVWVSAIDLAHADRRHRLGDGAPDVVASAIAADFCVLDDLLWGSQDDSLLEVISGRYNAGKPTIATAGSPYAELVARLGDAAVRRLVECRGVKGTLLDLFRKVGNG